MRGVRWDLDRLTRIGGVRRRELRDRAHVPDRPDDLIVEPGRDEEAAGRGRALRQRAVLLDVEVAERPGAHVVIERVPVLRALFGPDAVAALLPFLEAR